MKYLVGSLALFSGFLHADVWLAASNKMAKNDLQFLSSRNIITAPITTFPVAWSTILPELESAKIRTRGEKRAVERLLREYKLSNRMHVSGRLGSDGYALPIAADRQGDDSSLSLSANYSFANIKAKVNADIVNGDFSGSYLAIEQSGWLFYASQQEQFWGPGNDSSLIYSDLAESIPSVGIQRAQATKSELPILNWLGPWSFKAQMAQLESNRTVSDTKFWSTRFNFKPINALEIGLSHVALWGGEGFGNGLNDFFDVISGKDLCIDGSNNCDSALKSKFGNQLAGVDINLQLNFLGLHSNLYAQTIGEDGVTDGLLPADKVTMYGMSSNVVTNFGLLKVFIETTDSNLSCGTNKNIKNCFYEHNDYQSGYRYKNIPIGSQYDNDSTSYVLGITITNGSHFIESKVKRLSLNEDSSDISNATGAGGHYLVAEKTDLTLFEYSHQYDWSDTQRINLELQSKLKGSLPDNDDHIVNISYQHYF